MKIKERTEGGEGKGLRIWRRGKEADDENEDDEKTREQPCGGDSASNKKSGSNYTPGTFPGRPLPSSIARRRPSVTFFQSLWVNEQVSETSR